MSRILRRAKLAKDVVALVALATALLTLLQAIIDLGARVFSPLGVIAAIRIGAILGGVGVALGLAYVLWRFRNRFSPRWPDTLNPRWVWLIVSLSLVTALWALPPTGLGKLVGVYVSSWKDALDSNNVVKTFRPTINLPWFEYGQDFGEVPGWTRHGVATKQQIVDRELNEIAQAGFARVVWFLLGEGGILDQATPGLKPDFWEDYDYAIESAKRSGLRIVWVLMDYRMLMPERREGGALLAGRSALVADPGRRRAFLDAVVAPLASRHGIEPAIAGWILINEPENAIKEGIVTATAVRDFVREAANVIRRHTHRQPVSVGSADLESMLEYWSDGVDLDYRVFHHYRDHPPPPIQRLTELKPVLGSETVFVGEYPLAEPALPTADLVTAMRRLGYAGLWGWSLNDNTDKPRYRLARDLASSVSAVLSDRFNSPFQGLLQQADRDPWYASYSRTEIAPSVAKDLEMKRATLEHNRREDKNNIDWANSITSVLAGLALELPKAERAESSNERSYQQLQSYLKKTEAQISEQEAFEKQAIQNADRGWLEKTREYLQEYRALYAKHEQELREADARRQSAQRWLADINERIKEQEGYLTEAKRRVAQHRAQAEWAMYQLKWTTQLYRTN